VTSWGVTLQDANVILGVKTPGTLGVPLTTPPQTPRDNISLNAVIQDTASAARLISARDRKIQNAVVATGGSL
jgi:hypothetical protein